MISCSLTLLAQLRLSLAQLSPSLFLSFSERTHSPSGYSFQIHSHGPFILPNIGFHSTFKSCHVHGPFILLIIGCHCTFKLCHSRRTHSHLRWIHLKVLPVKTHSHVTFILPTIGFQSSFTFKTHSYSGFSFKDTFTCANYINISFFLCQDTFTLWIFLSRYIQTVHLYYQILAFIAHTSLAISL